MLKDNDTINMLLVDTSLYIEALKDNDMELCLRKLSKNNFILSCEIIENEINSASEFLRKTNRKEDAKRLKEIYRENLGGTIKLTDKVLRLSNCYSSEANNKIGKDKTYKMKNDFRIVASATVAGLKKILTLNRKTMAKPEIMQIYIKVNKNNKFKTPEFIRTKEDILKFASSI